MSSPDRKIADFRRTYAFANSRLRQYYVFGSLAGCVAAVRGGDIALLLMDVYDERFELSWRYSPDSERFPRDFASELVAEVVRPGPWEDLPFQREAQVIARAVPASLVVADDVGTHYVKDGHREAIGGLPVEGSIHISPTIPVEARSLEVSVLGVTFAITLRRT